MREFWKGKRVLITGHTGFKGSWLSIWLLEMGADVAGYALEPATDRDNFVLSGLSQKMLDIRGDIRDSSGIKKAFDQCKPEIVFHLAAQPLVRRSYELPVETYETNLMGTLNVLECIRASEHTRCAVMITTDKCYDNKAQIWGYRECDPLGGYDPYSSSKACAELLIASYRSSFINHESCGKAIASARAGNTIGGGDWSEDRIVPDCIRAIEADSPIQIRNPKSTRPWQHVIEPLSGYLGLAKKLYENPKEYAEAWNFGPNPESSIAVWDLCELIVAEYGRGMINDASGPNGLHEAGLLSLDISKSKFWLGFNPKWSAKEAVEKTVEWYKRYRENDVYALCASQISAYAHS